MVLVDPTGRESPVTVEAAPSFVTNHLDTALRATVEGAGISSQSMQMIATMLKSGQLRHVLRPWITDRFTVVAAFPSRKFMPARTRAVLDYLIEYAKRTTAGVDEEAAPSNRS
jgi:DNA-binding transcriptional LysR family regulator